MVKDCERKSRDIEAMIDSCMFVIGLMVTYFLFQTISVIYMFSTRGLLPRETQRKRMLICITILIIQTALVCAFYIVLNELVSRKYNFMQIGRLNQYFSIYKTIGFLLNATLLICTIYRLKKAKVKSTDTGHLNTKHAWALLVFLFLQIFLLQMTVFFPMSEMSRGHDLAKDFINFALTIMYFKMITNFITDFRIETKVCS